MARIRKPRRSSGKPGYPVDPRHLVEEDPAEAAAGLIEARRGLFPDTREEAYTQYLMHLMSLKGRGTKAVDPRLTTEWDLLKRREIRKNKTSREIWPKKLQHAERPRKRNKED